MNETVRNKLNEQYDHLDNALMAVDKNSLGSAGIFIQNALNIRQELWEINENE